MKNEWSVELDAGLVITIIIAVLLGSLLGNSLLGLAAASIFSLVIYHFMNTEL